MDVEGRAGDLLDRLDMLGFATGLTEEDLSGEELRQALCACCSKLAACLVALPKTDMSAGNSEKIIQAAKTLQAVSATQKEATDGRLGSALADLAKCIDASAPEATTKGSRVLHIELAVAHLQATRILAYKQQRQKQQQQKQQKQQKQHQQQQEHRAQAAASGAVDSKSDAEATAHLIRIATLLSINEVDSSAGSLLSQVVPAVSSLMSQLPSNFFQPLVNLQDLSDDQQQLLQEVDQALQQEYRLRRRMLIERIKVTLQSFLWSPRVADQGTKTELEALIARCQDQLQETPGVCLSDVSAVSLADVSGVTNRAAAGDVSSIEAAVKRVVIGKVPDRGGRPEGRARDARMPEWTARRSDSGVSGGEGCGRGGGRAAGGRGGGGRGGGGGSSYRGRGHRGRGGDSKSAGGRSTAGQSGGGGRGGECNEASSSAGAALGAGGRGGSGGRGSGRHHGGAAGRGGGWKRGGRH